MNSFFIEQFLQDRYTLDRKLGRSCYLIYDKINNSFSILKCMPPVQNKLHRIYRVIMKGSLPYQNEERMIDYFINNDININIPKIIEFRRSQYYIAEFIIENKFGTSYLERRLITTLMSIRELSKPQSLGYIKEFIFNIIEAPNFHILKNIYFIKGPIKKKSLLIFILQLNTKRLSNKNKIKPGIIHNDLGFNNVLTDLNKIIYIIDWEDSKWEKKWPLIDLTDISLNIESASFNNRMIGLYLIRMREKAKNITDELLAIHLCFGYVYSLLRAISLKKVPYTNKVLLIDKLNEFITYNQVRITWLNQIFKNEKTYH